MSLRFPALLLAGSVVLASHVVDVQAAQTSLIEFFNVGFNRTFLTGFADEISALDSGSVPGWVRTALEFKVDDTGGPDLAPVCRFYGVWGSKSTHFYTAFPTECEAVKANPQWTFEGIAFFARLPDDSGSCAPGTMPIYRTYNDGADGAPAHYFTPYPSDRCSYTGAGSRCLPEGSQGVAFCAPASLDLAQQRTQQLAGGTWEFSYAMAGTPIVLRATFGDAVNNYPVELPPRYMPDLPYWAQGVSSAGYPMGGGWDPVAGKIMIATLHTGFAFDYDGGSTGSGCAFYVEDPMLGPGSPCLPLTVRRL